MTRRTLGRWGGAAVAAALALHVVFWYSPRERASTPVGELAAPFPAAPTSRFALWLPYPHQNLARLDRRVGGLRAWAGRLAPARGLDLPSFGPFLLPPARELRAELGADGALRVEARIYPTIAALARAAGTVAGNPWLAGGEPPGRPGASVRWRGRIWSLTQPPEEAKDLSVQDQDKDRSERLPVNGVEGAGATPSRGAAVQEAPAFPSMEVFGLVWLGEPLGVLPRGTYGVVSAGGPGETLELVSAAALAYPPRPWARELVDAEADAPVGWLAERDTSGRVRAIAVWEGASGVRELPAIAVFESLPGPAVAVAGGDFSFALPGEGLLRLVGERAPEVQAAGLRIRALDRATVTRAAAWAPRLAAALPVAGSRGASALGAATPGRLATLVASAARVLQAVPFVDPREGERFALAAALLEPFRDCPLATLEVSEPGGVRLRPCPSGVLSGGRSD